MKVNVLTRVENSVAKGEIADHGYTSTRLNVYNYDTMPGKHFWKSNLGTKIA